MSQPSRFLALNSFFWRAYRAQTAFASEKALQTPEKSAWIEAQLTQTFIANTRTGIFALFIAILVVIVMLFGHVHHALLAGWVVLMIAVTAMRRRAIGLYVQSQLAKHPASLQQFFNSHRWIWISNALLWGVLVFMYYGRVPAENQYVCLLLHLGMGASAMLLFSSRPEIFRFHLVITYGLFALAVIYHGVSNQFTVHDLAVLVLGLLYGVTLSIAGTRLLAVQHRSYALQFDNEQLIVTLREKSDLALYAVKVKDRMLASAAHDLRQPVSALAFYADWLRNEPQMAADVLPKILLATDSVNALFNSLFDFAKIQAGAVQPKLEPVLVCQLVSDMMLQFSPAAQAKHLTFRQRINEAVVTTDALLIHRIVGNLLSNAIRYTERGGVLLTTRLRGNRVWIEVWDTGVGIAPEHQAHVFQEFYKASHHGGTDDGFGLGLAIVQRLCDVLGHKLSLRSRLGVGTRVRIELNQAVVAGPKSSLGTAFHV